MARTFHSQQVLAKEPDVGPRPGAPRVCSRLEPSPELLPPEASPTTRRLLRQLETRTASLGSRQSPSSPARRPPRLLSGQEKGLQCHMYYLSTTGRPCAGPKLSERWASSSWKLASTGATTRLQPEQDVRAGAVLRRCRWPQGRVGPGLPFLELRLKTPHSRLRRVRN